MTTIGDLVGGGDDRIRLGRVEQSEIPVDLRARRLEQAHRADLRAFESAPADREVLHRALGLRAPQGVDGHPHLAHRVVLDPVLGVSCVVLSAAPVEVMFRP